MALHLLRISVKGRFADLDPALELALKAEADQHDALSAAFTAEGTFTYGPELDFFTLRYDARAEAESPEEAEAIAVAACIEQAEVFLAEHEITHRGLRAVVSRPQAVWRDR